MNNPSETGAIWLFAEKGATSDAAMSVECLGRTFENDAARRAWYRDALRDKLRDPAFRQAEGFPEGTDADILALSDAPYYTACPNPFVDDFIRQYGKPFDPIAPYSREPFAVDVSEGKTDALYKAHGYHTKVPHLAIVPSILHYTQPGDVVLDGFCGSGMTGVAAQWCGTAPESYRKDLEAAWQREGLGKPTWGARRALLNDLAPAATFIAANYNRPFDVTAFETAGRRILGEVAQELGWMYETLAADGVTKGRIEYTVWSEIFTCPECAGEVVFMEEALEEKSKRVRDEFPCPHCDSRLTKDNLQRVFETRIDPAIGGTWRRVKFKPVLIVYEAGGKRLEKKPDENDLQVLREIEKLPFPPEVPTNRFPVEKMYHGTRIAPKGFTHVHHFFLPRAAHALAAVWRKASSHPDPRTREALIFFAEQAIWTASVLNRFRPTGYSQVNQYLTGVYYVASQHAECSPWYILDGKVRRLASTFRDLAWEHAGAMIATGSAAGLNLPADSIDYIFTDPPFGENIFYADLNFLVETWHRVLTSTQTEAIVDKFKGKGMPEYQHLMQRCFEEYCRVLKPGRWMTVVFHNSRSAVWGAIQEAMLAAGFVVADVRTLDKQQGSYRQVTSTAPKQDLVISAYRPNGGLERRFKLEAETEEGVWDFIRTHLRQLPLFVAKGGRAEVVAERLNHLLFDRMVAFHVQRNKRVPLSLAEFYAALEQRFGPTLDGMYFLPEQAAEYDRRRRTVQEVAQLKLFVTDEASAILWLKQQLQAKPQTEQDLNPQFMKELAGWQKHERRLELRELMQQNFLCYDGADQVPCQIHSYLSTNFHDLRGLGKDATSLKQKAQDRWYVPDPRRTGDLEKLRERALLREFEEYREAKTKRLKVLRVEAVRAGFRKAWQDRDYVTILEVAAKIPENVLQEDAKLLMWYDQALTRSGIAT